MKVVVLDALGVEARGKGISRAVKNIVERLVSEPGSLRYMIVTTEDGASQLAKVPRQMLHVVPSMLGSRWEQIGLPAVARRLQGDLIFMHRECGPLWGPRYLLHVPEDPAIRWKRDPPRSVRGRARISYQKAVMPHSLRRARKILTSSMTTADSLSRSFRIARESIRVVPLGVDERFASEAVERPSGAPYIFHLGSADPRDNSSKILEAVASMKAHGISPPELRIAGDLGLGRQEMMRLTHELDLETHVRFLGRVTDHELAELYAGADVCVQPSEDEGFGFQPLEAMASGCPVIVLDTPAVRETVGDAGMRVPSADPKVLADALRTLISDAVRRDELARAGRGRSRSFRWEQTVAAIRDEIEGSFGET